MRTCVARTLAAVVGLGALVDAGCGTTTGSSEGASSSATTVHPLIGSVPPDFSEPSANGAGGKAKVAFKQDTAGKVAIVDFWATWCEPCKKSFPKLQALHAKYEAKGLVLIGVSEDDEKTGLKEFGSTYGATFPLVWDDGKGVAGKWQPKSMPATFIVDRKGVVRFVHLGYHDGEEQELDKEVRSLL